MRGEGHTCGNCVCFYHDMSKASPNFPARSGCIEAFVSMRIPHDRQTATPDHIHQFGLHFTEANTPAAGCADFTMEDGHE